MALLLLPSVWKRFLKITGPQIISKKLFLFSEAISYKRAHKKRKCWLWVRNSCILSTVMIQSVGTEAERWNQPSWRWLQFLFCFLLAKNVHATLLWRPSHQHVVLWWAAFRLHSHHPHWVPMSLCCPRTVQVYQAHTLFTWSRPNTETKVFYYPNY